mgnify:CR=1|jgi:predicted DNA-binding transcriptional regulator AlpA
MKILEEQLSAKLFWKLRELATILGVSEVTIITWRKEGKFPQAHTGNQYSSTQILDWYNKNGEWANEH